MCGREDESSVRSNNIRDKKKIIRRWLRVVSASSSVVGMRLTGLDRDISLCKF